MSDRKTAATVAGGYLAALLAAAAVMAWQQRPSRMAQPDMQGGMAAFGDLMLAVFVFSFVALVPTAIALRALRRFERFWMVLGNACIAVAGTGVFAVVVYATQKAGWPADWGAVAVLRVLVAPPLAAALVVATLAAPSRATRLRFMTAAAMELAVCAAAGLWFVVTLWQHDH